MDNTHASTMGLGGAQREPRVPEFASAEPRVPGIKPASVDQGLTDKALTDKALSVYQGAPHAADEYKQDRDWLKRHGAEVSWIDRHFAAIEHIRAAPDPLKAFQYYAPEMWRQGFNLNMVSSHLPGGCAYRVAHQGAGGVPGFGQRVARLVRRSRPLRWAFRRLFDWALVVSGYWG